MLRRKLCFFLKTNTAEGVYKPTHVHTHRNGKET